MRLRTGFVLSLGATLAGWPSLVRAQSRVNPIVTEGDPIPGLPGVTFDYAQVQPLMSRQGDVLITARLLGQSLPAGQANAVLRAGSGGIEVIAQSNTPAPGTPSGVTFSSGNSLRRAQFWDNGSVFFFANVSGPGITSENDAGYWADTGSGLALRLRKGDQAPGTAAGVRFHALRHGGIAETGDIIASAEVTGPGVTVHNDRGFWAGTSTNLHLIARTGDQPIGLPAGMAFFELRGPALNQLGEVAFAGRASDGASELQGIWSGSPGDMRLRTSTGDPAPGFADGWTIQQFGTPALNRAGQMAFQTVVANGTQFRHAIMMKEGESTSLVTSVGDQVPGFGPGHSFIFMSPGPTSGSAPDRYALNDRGHLLYFGTFSAPGFPSTGSGWFRAGDGETVPIATTRSQAPGMPEGVFFNDIRQASMNDLGQVVFIARTDSSDYDLWGFDGLTSRRLLGPSDVLEVGPGDLRTVAFFSVAVGELESTDSRAIDNNGMIALSISFTDNSYGVYTIAIPAPGAAMLAFTSTALLARRRRATFRH